VHGAVVGVEATGAVDDGDLPVAEQPGEATGEAVDDALLAVLGDRQVETGRLGEHAEVLRALDGAADRRGLEEGLGGDAADVEAGAADLVALDQRDVESGRRPVERRGIAAGTTAHDDDVEVALGAVAGLGVLVLSRLDHLHARVSTPILPSASAAADR
jgi:hypothetical protein